MAVFVLVDDVIGLVMGVVWPHLLFLYAVVEDLVVMLH